MAKIAGPRERAGLSEPPVYAPLEAETSLYFTRAVLLPLFTYTARMLTAKANPINSGASPVFDFVSSATMRMTVTRTNVTIASIKIPLRERNARYFRENFRFLFYVTHTCQFRT